MHELSLTETLIDLVQEQVQGAQVQRVVLEIGQLSAVLPEAMQFCFTACCAGTSLAAAQLEIVEVPGLAHCQDCGASVALEQPFGLCDRCGSLNLHIVQGQDLLLKSIELISPMEAEACV
jgi:hydrogenase nickel incorporation protein HypA/HybF